MAVELLWKIDVLFVHFSMLIIDDCINAYNVVETRKRLDNLELDVSFSALINMPTTINDNPTLFNVVKHNMALAYDSSTGTSTREQSMTILQLCQ